MSALDVDAPALARRFHEAYERLAPMFGYATRTESARAWDDVPEANRGLMVAVCAEIIADDATVSPFDKRCADRLAREVNALVLRGVISSRSSAADALLDYASHLCGPIAKAPADAPAPAVVTDADLVRAIDAYWGTVGALGTTNLAKQRPAFLAGIRAALAADRAARGAR